MAYPGFGGAPGYPVQPDPLYGYFAAVAGPALNDFSSAHGSEHVHPAHNKRTEIPEDQQIDAHELQRCLSSSGISGNYQQFSLDTCRIMIAMLNRDQDARMGFNEFKELWNVLNHWKTTFIQYDRDRSGTVEPHELQAALTSWGYNLSPTAIQIIVNRYSTNHRISFDDFVACAVRLRSLTEHFRRRDTSQQGVATFRYDDFIQVSMFT